MNQTLKISQGESPLGSEEAEKTKVGSSLSRELGSVCSYCQKDCVKEWKWI